MLYHKSHVLNTLTMDHHGAWVADSLSRDRVGDPTLEFTDCVMVKKSLLASVRVTLKNREAAEAAMRGIQPYAFLIEHEFVI